MTATVDARRRARAAEPVAVVPDAAQIAEKLETPAEFVARLTSVSGEYAARARSFHYGPGGGAVLQLARMLEAAAAVIRELEGALEGKEKALREIKAGADRLHMGNETGVGLVRLIDRALARALTGDRT